MGASAERRMDEQKGIALEFEFPRILMIVGEGEEELRFLPFQEAGVLFDSGWVRVKVGGVVIEDANLTSRPTTNEDRARIQTIADEYSASK